jgi:RNA polymerase sigma factor (sigma-70 family)
MINSRDPNLHPQCDDQHLIKSLISNDESAYTSIYQTYSDSLYAYGVSLGFEEEKVKDAIHDVFFKLYFNRKALQDVVNLKYYLFRMLKNRLLDIYKTMIDTDSIEAYTTHFSIHATILDELIAREEKEAINKQIETLMDCLTDRQREAIYLRYMQEMSYEEIASLLKMTPPATRKLISRAIQRMRSQE